MKCKYCNITEDDWKVVEARLESFPEDMSIGFHSQIFNKYKLLKEIRNRTEAGHIYAHMQLEFIKWLLTQSKLKEARGC